VIARILPGLLAVFFVAGLAGAQGQARREGPDLGDSERALQQKQRQLKEERAKVAQAKKREASILAELEETEKQIGEKRRQVAVLDNRVKRAQADVTGLQGEIGRLEVQRAGQEESLGRRLRLLYKLQSQGGVLPLVLSGDDPLAQAIRLRHLTTLATVDARSIREYRSTSEGLADRKVRVEARRVELASLRNEDVPERDRHRGGRGNGHQGRVPRPRGIHGLVPGVRQPDHRGSRRRVLHAVRACRRHQGERG
jgi:septal ring factor EnvC (AmiA/AmiB activator)